MQATVRTGLGKSKHLGSQGGLKKLEIRRKYDHAVHIERVHVGHSLCLRRARFNSIPTIRSLET